MNLYRFSNFLNENNSSDKIWLGVNKEEDALELFNILERSNYNYVNN